MDKIIAIIEETDPIKLSDEGITLHFLLVITYEIFKRKLTLKAAKEIRIPSEIVGIQGQTMVAQQEYDAPYFYANVDCYKLLALLGKYNKLGHLVDVGFVEEEEKVIIDSQSGRITSDTPNIQEVERNEDKS